MFNCFIIANWTAAIAYPYGYNDGTYSTRVNLNTDRTAQQT